MRPPALFSTACSSRVPGRATSAIHSAAVAVPRASTRTSVTTSMNAGRVSRRIVGGAGSTAAGRARSWGGCTAGAAAPGLRGDGLPRPRPWPRASGSARAWASAPPGSSPGAPRIPRGRPPRPTRARGRRARTAARRARSPAPPARSASRRGLATCRLCVPRPPEPPRPTARGARLRDGHRLAGARVKGQWTQIPSFQSNVTRNGPPLGRGSGGPRARGGGRSGSAGCRARRRRGRRAGPRPSP